MREADFLQQFLQLINTDVLDLTLEQKTGIIQTLCDEVHDTNGQKFPTCRIVPFVTGRRPVDEAAHPGLGSSDNTSMICAFPDPETNKTYILFELAGLDQYTPEECDALALEVTLSFAGTDDSQETRPLPGWNKRPIEPIIFEKARGGKPTLRPISLRRWQGIILWSPCLPKRISCLRIGLGTSWINKSGRRRPTAQTRSPLGICSPKSCISRSG